MILYDIANLINTQYEIEYMQKVYAKINRSYGIFTQS